MSSSSSSSNIRVLRTFPKISDIYLICVCVSGWSIQVPLWEVWWLEESWWELVLGYERRLSDMAASAFIHWVISLA